ncbi:MAG: hypothetical protein AAGA30_01200 [Planctomycetota bacterium]
MNDRINQPNQILVLNTRRGFLALVVGFSATVLVSSCLACSGVILLTSFGAAVTLGVVCVVVHLCSMWTMLGPSSYLVNSFLSLVALSIVTLAYWLPICWVDQGPYVVIGLTFISIILFLNWFIVHLMFGGLRLLAGWRIRTILHPSKSAFSIFDVLTFTVVCALVLALIRGPDQSTRFFFLPELTTMAVFGVLKFAFISCPAIWVYLKTEFKPVYATRFTIYAICLFACIGIFIGSTGGPYMGLLAVVELSLFTFSIVITTKAFRRAGFVLATRGSLSR